MDDQSFELHTRVTAAEKRCVSELAAQERVTVAEWLRKLVRNRLEYKRYEEGATP